MRAAENNFRIALLVAGVLAATMVSGCGGGQSAPPPISVSVSPSAVPSLDQGQSANFTATVVNDAAAKGVSWSVGGSGCTGAACGTISAQSGQSATYLAPSSVSANLAVKIVATAIADITKSSSASIAVVPPPTVTATSLPSATAGVAYSATLHASGGITPYSWGVSGGTFPPGLNLNGDGSISGSPSAGGTFSFTVQVADSGNPALTATANLSIASSVLPLSITTNSLPDGTVDIAYKQPIQAAGGIPPYTWSIASGSLPPWATQNSATGSISGIPGASGSASFVARVTDSETIPSVATQSLTLSVVAGSAANNSELSGHYAFLFNGFDDATGSQLAIAGSFTSDGKGNIASGIEDENGPGSPLLNVPFTGTYNIGSDHRGAMTIATANGTTTYSLVLGSINSGVAQKGRFIEFDDATGVSGHRGSGVLRLQDTSAFARSKITGAYAFGLEGQKPAGARQALAGSFTADGAGTIPNGLADLNIAGTTSNPTLSGTYNSPSGGNGRSSMKLIPSTASSLDLAVYVVSAKELFVMTTNTFASDGLISGTVLSQTSTSFDNSSLNSPAVFYQLGVNQSAAATQSFAEIGVLVPNGNGGLTATYDRKLGTTLNGNATFAASYSVLPGGRVSISGWYGDSSSALRMLYLVDKNTAFFLDTSAGVGFGFVQPRSAAPAGGFSNASLSGTFADATAPPSIAPNANGCGVATLDSSGAFNQTTDVSTPTGLSVDQTTSGAYSIDTNGRGSITNLVVTSAITSNAALGTFLAGASLFIWRKPKRKRSRPAHAIFFLTLWLVSTPAGCPKIPFNKLVFYVLSPTSAVMLHEGSSDVSPVITFIEQ